MSDRTIDRIGFGFLCSVLALHIAMMAFGLWRIGTWVVLCQG